MTNNVVEFNNFSFSYGSSPILHQINLNVKVGQYVSVIGPNGAGKSTLLKNINRIVKGGTGEVLLFGKELARYKQKDIGRLVGYVQQARDRIYSYRVFDFVLMGRYPYLNPLSRVSSKDKDVVHHMLDVMGIASFANRDMNTLSGGERQKVYLAAALAQEPKLLLLDEPTTYLDPKYEVEIQKTISKTTKRLGISVMHVTHDLNHIYHWSQHVVAMKEGRILFQGKAQDVLTESHLKDIFDTEFHLMKDPDSGKIVIVTKVGV